MAMHIIGSFEKDRLFCAGSFTKLVTTYVCLSFLAEQHDISIIIDDNSFLNHLAQDQETQDFLQVFQTHIGGSFTIRDLCSYYSGLPYTFGLTEEELENVDSGRHFKHHQILTEKDFIARCHNQIVPIYPLRSKFHYSEIGVLFLGYFIEKVYTLKIEDLYQKYVLDKFKLPKSQFSRIRPAQAYCQDLSPHYDYPSIAILDHGYFSYSNGYFTTLNEMKVLLEHLLREPVFHEMTKLSKARAASNRLLNGLAVELRLVDDDIIYGYEGLSYSGCNIFAYSTKKKEGYLTFSNNEETVYDEIYGQLGYTVFDKVPVMSQVYYSQFLDSYDFESSLKDIPESYQGRYHRVQINETELADVFVLGPNYMLIRNPDEIRYELMYHNNHYHVRCKDKVQGSAVLLYTAKSGNKYFTHDGTLYRRFRGLASP